MTKVAVFIEGGVCVGVSCDQDVECLVIDRDDEQAEEADGEPSEFKDGASVENLPYWIW